MKPLAEEIAELRKIAEEVEGCEVYWSFDPQPYLNNILKSLPRLLDELEAHHKMVKWLEYFYNEKVGERQCPICDVTGTGHDGGCELAALLSRWGKGGEG